VDALVVQGPADRIRAAVGTRAQVLTGADRQLADPDPEATHSSLLNMNTFLSVAGGLAAFVAVGHLLRESTLAAVATGLNMAGTLVALGRLVGATPVVLPWWPLVALVAGSTALALLGGVLTVRVGLRAPAVELVGIRE
jgi:putative ABC transport system permease protein